MNKNRCLKLIGLSLSTGLILGGCSDLDLINILDTLVGESDTSSEQTATPPSTPVEPEQTQPGKINPPIVNTATEWSFLDFSKSHAFYFILDSQHIWAGTRAPNFLNGGSISFSTDQGQNWKIQTEKGLANTNAIHFFNAREGWAIGGGEGFGLAMYIGQTQNGGKTWEKLNDPFLSSKKQAGLPVVNSPFYLMSAIDIEQTFVAEGAAIWHTQNAGELWQAVPIPGYDSDATQDGRIKDIAFFESGKGYVLSQKRLFLSSDFGVSWSTMGTPWQSPETYTQFDRIVTSHFKNDALGHIVIRWKHPEESQFIEVLYRTLDGGKNWQSVYTSRNNTSKDQPKLEFNTLYFLNQNTGWTGGYGDFIAETHNGGQSWKVVHSTGKNRSIIGFHPSLSEGKLFATTSKGYWVSELK